MARVSRWVLVTLSGVAVGIGVNSAIFGIVNSILLRPQPVERPNELVDIYGHAATSTAPETHQAW